MPDALSILMPDGTPAPASLLRGGAQTAEAQQLEVAMKNMISYASSLAGVNMRGMTRARDPFANHSWFFVAAMATALNMIQAPYVIYREGDEATRRRTKALADRAYSATGVLPRGLNRRSMYKHTVMNGWSKGHISKEAEPDLDHPLNRVFMHPNEITASGAQLFFLTFLWFSMRMEAFWLLLDENSEPVAWTDTDKIDQIWCVSPDLVKERIVGNSWVGWDMNVNPTGARTTERVFLLPDELIHFKLPNPFYPIRGIDPRAPLASTIAMDMLSVEHNITTLQNGGEPSGVLYHTGQNAPFRNTGEELAFKEKWKQRHEGIGKERKTALLTGGWKYESLGYTPHDMDFINARNFGRDETFAVLGVPKSVAGITDDVPYAVQLGQDRNFWEKRLLPYLTIFQSTLDGTLFYPLTDDIFGMFDTSKVEALRFGLQDKVAIVTTLTAPGIHMPPKQAFEMTGLTPPAYEGDDVATGYQPMPDVPVDGAGEPVSSPPGTAIDQNKKTTIVRAKTKIVQASWSDVIGAVQAPYEKKFKRAWREFVAKVRIKQMKKFDKWARVVRADFDEELDDLDLDEEELRKMLKIEMRTLYEDEVEETLDSLKGEVGNTFDVSLDHPGIQKAIKQREKILLGSAPATMQKRMRESVRKGLEKGETVQTLRERVGTAYSIESSSARALTIARTESAGIMNEAREVVFAEQEFEKREWSTAGDEHVRDDHVEYGASGEHEMGFNYLELVDKEDEGSLLYPSDTNAPADQVINCRCVHLPA